jgi:hypothetical protein
MSHEFRSAEDYRDHLPCEECEPTGANNIASDHEARLAAQIEDLRRTNGAQLDRLVKAELRIRHLEGEAKKLPAPARALLERCVAAMQQPVTTPEQTQVRAKLLEDLTQVLK